MTHDPQSYGHLAEHYHHLTEFGPDPVVEWLPSVLPSARTNALDVGCGAGRHAVVLAETFERVTAVDLSASMIDLARRTNPGSNIEYAVSDALDVQGHFDLVFSSAMLHHVHDLPAVLAHLRSLVAPSGRALLLDVTAPSSPLHRAAMSVAPRMYYRLGALRALVTSALTRDRDAMRKFRAATHAGWLNHLATDKFLTSDDFDRACTEAFPHCTFTDLGYLRACVYDAPH